MFALVSHLITGEMPIWAGGGWGKPSMLGIINGSGDPECVVPTAAAAAAILFAWNEYKKNKLYKKWKCKIFHCQNE